MVVFIILSSLGTLHQELKRGTGSWLLPGGKILYTYHLSNMYSWEKGYDQVVNEKGRRVEEVECGELNIALDENEVYKTSKSGGDLFVESKCSSTMGLDFLLNQYVNASKASDEKINYYDKPFDEQITIFNQLKAEGVFDDVRYKKITIINWDLIWEGVWLRLVLPLLATAAIFGAIHFFTRSRKRKVR